MQISLFGGDTIKLLTEMFVSRKSPEKLNAPHLSHIMFKIKYLTNTVEPCSF